MSRPTIRLATPDDGPELARLRWQMAAEDGPVDQTLESFAATFVPTWRGMCAGARWRVWVAEEGGRPPRGADSSIGAARRLVGCVWVEWVDRVPRPIEGRSNSLGYVTSVYVAPEWRNGGLGSRLLRAAVADAREIGHASLFLWPSERSVPFYRRAGFQPGTELHELVLAGGRHRPSGPQPEPRR